MTRLKKFNNYNARDYGSALRAFVVAAVMSCAFAAPASFAVQPPAAHEPSASKTAEAPAISQVSINTADTEALQALDGIGESKAKAIVDWRETHGKFSSVEELTEVQGIGEVTLEKNRDRLTL